MGYCESVESVSQDPLQIINSPDQKYSISYQPNARKGLVGLDNLGNTCFMNSALQCLSQTVPLKTFFLTKDYKREINKINPLGTKGKVANAYFSTLKIGMGNYYISYGMVQRILSAHLNLNQLFRLCAQSSQDISNMIAKNS